MPACKQTGSLYHFYDGIWYDPAGARINDLPHVNRIKLSTLKMESILIHENIQIMLLINNSNNMFKSDFRITDEFEYRYHHSENLTVNICQISVLSFSSKGGKKGN